MNFKIELTDQPSQHVLSIRTRTSVENLPEEIGKAYNSIMQYLKEIESEPSDVPFVAYYNLDMENLDVEMGFPVSKPMAGKGNIESSEIPAGKQISCMFKGPYKDMEAPYNEMMQWIKENEYTATGVSYEFYYNSPMDVPESELLTKIVFPVK
ncbi:GyrI-like domain-containing protein [Brassicibacter mesophilus]|uniref:GyrI-like domain-containing protein n=1 Tax=Brassicibacter mesophilus TaxID=745119 RepID=UPI003D1C3EC5